MKVYSESQKLSLEVLKKKLQNLSEEKKKEVIKDYVQLLCFFIYRFYRQISKTNIDTKLLPRRITQKEIRKTEKDGQQKQSEQRKDKHSSHLKSFKVNASSNSYYSKTSFPTIRLGNYLFCLYKGISGINDRSG